MTNTQTPTNFMHEIPEDIQKLLDSNPKLQLTWDKLTPLARNEWICWVTIVKQDQTRKEHLFRMQTEILEGKKRPCCWPGCPHRRPNAAKYFSKKPKVETI
jgi:uncharacterized protein YdeI (YjbR/CyaY-like superfamily)